MICFSCGTAAAYSSSVPCVSENAVRMRCDTPRHFRFQAGGSTLSLSFPTIGSNTQREAYDVVGVYRNYMCVTSASASALTVAFALCLAMHFGALGLSRKNALILCA